MSAKRHRVSNLKLREISSVDRPAQVGAVSVLIKRAESRETELIKASFQQALTGCLLADQVREAFYSSFENMYEGKDAFRKALVDELAAGGTGDVAATDYKAWLATLVDAATTAAKAAGAANMPADLNKVFTDAADDWLNEQETDMTIKTKAELTAAIEKAQAAGDKVTVADVTTIHKAAAELKAEDLLPASGVLAKAATTPALDDATATAVTRMVKRDALSVDLRKHYDGLADDAARDAFLAKSATDQATELTKGLGDDPVVYTTLDGVDIRKSHGDVTLSLAKGRDADRRELVIEKAAREDTELTKRAGDLLGNIGGELVGKKALLKALGTISDTATRDLAEAVLKSANEVGKGAFIRKGAGGSTTPVAAAADGNGPEMSEAEAELDRLAKAAATGGKSYEAAYAEVIQTAAGSQLYKRFVEGE